MKNYFNTIIIMICYCNSIKLQEINDVDEIHVIRRKMRTF